MNQAYLNGAILPYRDCALHISDLQIQRGYGIFDFFRCRNGEIPWLDDYEDRLFRSLQLSGLEQPLTRREFRTALDRLQEKNGGLKGAFKVIVTGGESENLEGVSGKPTIIILQVDWSPPPPESLTAGVNLVSDYFIRPNPEVKTLYYFNSLRLREKIREYNAVDVLYYGDTVSECSRASVFWVKDGKLCTPGTNILKSITRKRVLELATDTRITDPAPDELLAADEVFIASTSRDVTPVVSIDGRKIGSGRPGKIARELRAAFLAAGW